MGQDTEEKPTSSISVPESYQAVWASNTGKTVINVNAGVEISNAGSYPTIAAGVTSITQQQADSLAAVLFGADGYQLVDETKGDTSYRSYESNLMNIDGYPQGYMYVHNDTQGDTVINANLSYTRENASNEYRYFSTEPFLRALSGENVTGSAYSYTEAEALACQVSDALSAELTNIVCGEIKGELPNQSMLSDTLEASPVNAYRFDFTRTVGGTPVTFSYESGGATDRDDQYSVNSCYERLSVVISDVGVYAVEYINPLILTETENESATLLSFNDAMNIAATIMPLKFAYREQGAVSLNVDIDRITLGYMRVQKRDRPGEYTMIPVWDFFGGNTCVLESGETVINDWAYMSQLTLNALDGTVIDREYGY